MGPEQNEARESLMENKNRNSPGSLQTWNRRD
jgi:hypothetical protein